MAEGLLRRLAGDRFEVLSAGTDPVPVHPGAIEAMSEIGIDISVHESKPVDRFVGQDFEYVISVCDQAAERCPVLPGVMKRLAWNFSDPAAVKGPDSVRRQAFRSIRDQIAERIPRIRRYGAVDGITVLLQPSGALPERDTSAGRRFAGDQV